MSRLSQKGDPTSSILSPDKTSKKSQSGLISQSSRPMTPAVNKVNEGEKEANCLASERDEKDGAMFREHAKPRVGVAEIRSRRRADYL
ncbi:MAG: hypothetical protein WAV46_01190 [Candidatus Moraniibacteriota bacterium]